MSDVGAAFLPEIDDHRSFPHDMEFTVTNLHDWFYYRLNGPHGATQFVMFRPGRDRSGWTGADVGYHAPEPRYSGHDSIECDLLPEGHCYYDGSGLRAMDWLKRWDGTRRQMLDWLMLEYRALFMPSLTEDGAA